jgi:hypothetical protein
MSESIQPSYSPNYFSLSDILATQVCTQTLRVQLIKFFSVSLVNLDRIRPEKGYPRWIRF